MSGTGSWGSGGWGSGSYGGGSSPASAIVVFVGVQAIAENILQVQFSTAIYLTGIFDTQDAAIVSKWSVIADSTSVGLNGDVARPVNVVQVELATDGIPEAQAGMFVNLILDRPMTPWPAVYNVTWTGIFSGDPTPIADGAGSSLAVYRAIQRPTTDVARPSRDFANPQTLLAARDSIPNPTSALFPLGTFAIGDDGDYAFDQGIQSLKKRVLRRLFTRKDAFAHLPGYGVGVPDQVKKLGTAAVAASLRADAESQIAQEPEVSRVKVQIIRSATAPNLARLRIAIRPNVGVPIAFEAPVDLTNLTG